MFQPQRFILWLIIKNNVISRFCSSYTSPWTTDDGDINTLRPRQNGRHFADDSFKCIFLNENVWFSIKISLKFVPKGLINNIPALVQIMAWRRPGDRPLSEPMLARLLTHICVTRPQWVKPVSTSSKTSLALAALRLQMKPHSAHNWRLACQQEVLQTKHLSWTGATQFKVISNTNYGGYQSLIHCIMLFGLFLIQLISP